MCAPFGKRWWQLSETVGLGPAASVTPARDMMATPKTTLVALYVFMRPSLESVNSAAASA